MDEHVRQLENQQSSFPTLEGAAGLLRARIRAGMITQNDVRAAAGMGCKAAELVLGKTIPNLDNLTKHAYIVLGYTATQLPIIKNYLDSVEMPDDWQRYITSVEYVAEAAIAKNRDPITIPQIRPEYVTKVFDAAQFLSAQIPVRPLSNDVYTELLDAYHLPDGDTMELADRARVIGSQMAALQHVMKCITRRPKHYLDLVWERCIRTIWYVEQKEGMPAAHRFNDSWGARQGGFYEELTYPEFIAWRNQDLLDRIAPLAIERLVGPHIM